MLLFSVRWETKILILSYKYIISFWKQLRLMHRGLRLKVQADGELITSGIVDALEEVDVSPVLVVNGSAEDSADVLLDQLEDGLWEEISENEEF